MATAKEVGAALEKTPEMKPVRNTLGSLLQSEDIKARFKQVLGAKAAAFMSSIVSVANNNAMLATADPMSVIQAAAVAATLDLPINPSLGFAHLVPYRDGKTGRVVAQFQLGWRGLVQLAQRTGTYRTMNAGKLYEGQLIENDLLTGHIKVDAAAKKSDVVIGYFAHFELLNGFEKTVFIAKEDAEKHGRRYSKSYETGQWKKDFDAMAVKTAVKQLLGKWAPLSTDYQMQKALQMDQAVIKEDGTPDYIDNKDSAIDVDVTTDAAADNVGADGKEITL